MIQYLAREGEREREKVPTRPATVYHTTHTHPHCAFPSVPRLLSHSTCIHLSLSLSLSPFTIALPPSRAYIHATTLVYTYVYMHIIRVRVYTCASPPMGVGSDTRSRVEHTHG